MGVPCRFDGTARPNGAVLRLAELAQERGASLLLVCPESSGGLPCPRPAAELQPDGRVVDRQGRDVTEAFVRGARHSVEAVANSVADLVVLKAKSPSCGRYQVYDGTFGGVLVDGMGLLARSLVELGVEVVDEVDVEAWLARLDASGEFR